MKFGFIGDPHFQLEATSRLDNVIQTLDRKFEYCFDVAREQDLKAIFILGDLFHIKSSVKVRHSLVKEMIRIFKKCPCQLYSIVGNHDITNNRLDSVSTQPIGVLFESGVVKLLDEATFGFNIKDSPKVRFVGVHYSVDMKMKDYVVKKSKAGEWLVLCSHWVFDKEPGNFWGYKMIGFSELRDSEVDIIVNGHDHQFKTFEAYGKQFYQPGSILRGTLSEEDLNRIPRFLILDFDEKVCIPHYAEVPHEEVRLVLNVEKKEKEKKEEKEISDFVQVLDMASKIKKKGDYTAVLDSMEVDITVKEKLRDYIHQQG